MSNIYDDAYQGAYKFARATGESDAQNALARQAGRLIAGGDPAGARNALYSAGEIDAGGKVDEQIASKRKSEAEGLDRFTTGVQRLIEHGMDPQKAWEAGASFAPRLGIDPAELQQVKPHYDADPKAFLTFANEQAKKELEFAKSSDGSYSAIDKTTGRPVYQYQAPTPDKYEQYDPEKELRRIPGRPGSAQGGQIPATEPPQEGQDWLADVAQAAPDAQVTSGYRTPQRNAAVGGKPNSRHLSGQAVDLVPRAGETMGHLYARVSKVPGVRAINEGDHVHVQRTGQPAAAPAAQGGAPELVRAARPKDAEPVWTPDGKGLLINKNGDRKADPAFAGSPQAGKVTESERTAGFLSARLADSLKNLTAISQTDPAARKPGLMETAAERAPAWLGGGSGAANLVRSADRQQVIANQLDVLDAALTLGTGAAYTREQLINYRSTYFPNLTDKPETVRAKGQKLIALLDAAKIKAGRSAPPALDTALAAARAQYAATAPANAAAPAAKAQGGGQQRRLSPDEAAKLKPGTRFTGQDGVERIRQ